MTDTTDMTAFERRLSGEIAGLMGPVRPVDDGAILAAITATQSPKWRFQTMFGAARLAGATAIVAMVGGLLVLTSPLAGDRAQVVGASASPSLADDRSALDGYRALRSLLTTAEVAPGVHRVIDDGAGHELADLRPTEEDAAGITVAPDGSVWLLTPERFIQLGVPGSHPGAGDEGFGMYDLTIDRDGTPWAVRRVVSDPDGPRRAELIRFQDGEWTSIPRADGESHAVEILPDGSVWTRDQGTLARLDEDAWTTFEFEAAAIPLPDEDDWVFPGHLASTPDGSLWVASSALRDGIPRGGLARFDGSSWELVEPLGEDHRSVPSSLAASDDGVLWAALDDPARSTSFLARLDEAGWTVLGEEDGAERVGKRGWWVGQMAVVPGGRLLATVGPTGGWSRHAIYDGDGLVTTVPNLARGDGVASMAGAPDGTFWVADGGGLFIIDPDAVAAAE